MKNLLQYHPYEFLRAAGSALAVTIILTACGGGGGGGSSGEVGGASAPGEGGASAVFARFAYVANEDSNSVSVYAVTNDTGRLRYQSTVAAGTRPQSVTVDPSGRFAYVVNLNSNDVSQYAIGADGALTKGMNIDFTPYRDYWSRTVISTVGNTTYTTTAFGSTTELRKDMVVTKKNKSFLFQYRLQ